MSMNTHCRSIEKIDTSYGCCVSMRKGTTNSLLNSKNYITEVQKEKQTVITQDTILHKVT